MRDCELKVLEQYPIEVKGTRKARGAFFCDTNQGVFLLKEISFSEKRLPLLYKMCTQLEGMDGLCVDTIVPNIQGEYVSIAEDQKKYILKKWFQGRECDVKKETEVLETVRNLAKLHLAMKELSILEEDLNMIHTLPPDYLYQEYNKHNRELKKIRSFIKGRVVKNDFEFLYLKSCAGVLEVAENVSKRLKDSQCSVLYRESVRKHDICHGDYNYHNVLMTNQGIATTNFERFHIDVQVSDLSYYLRKVMEKYSWDRALGLDMIQAYDKIRPLNHAEKEYIALRLAYPEKFWKIANTYYHSNKAWLPVKNIEKLQIEIAQMNVKSEFLIDLFSFHL